MAGMSTAKRAELEVLRADLQQTRGDIDFRSQAHLPPHGGHLSALDRAIAHVSDLLGDDDEEAAALDTSSTQEPTVPPGSAGGAAADPGTGATTNVPFSTPLSEGDTSSIPGTPDYDPAAQSEVERDAARRQHAAERGETVELREPAVPGADAGTADPLSVLSEEQRAALAEAGYDTPAAIRAASDEQLDAVPGIGPATVEKLREATRA